MVDLVNFKYFLYPSKKFGWVNEMHCEFNKKILFNEQDVFLSVLLIFITNKKDLSDFKMCFGTIYQVQKIDIVNQPYIFKLNQN